MTHAKVAGVRGMLPLLLVGVALPGGCRGAGAAGSCSAQGSVCTQGLSTLQGSSRVRKAPLQDADVPPLDLDLLSAGIGSAENGTAGGCCADFGQWPSVDNGVTCGDCTALVLTARYGGRCDRYCGSFGHVCVAAAEERAEGCGVKYSSPCNVAIGGTSDMLCKCSRPSGQCATPAPAPVPAPPPPTETACCKPFGEWPSVDNGVTCGECMALVLTQPYGGRCDRYCESFGHVCVGAAEEEAEGCGISYSSPCDAEIAGTSDMLCACRLPDPAMCSAPPPSAPPAPPART
eukprot:CAMPEP_0204515944 /NCGR_PEP_ID=MMETSP0661-20131031/2886_1 /ASSEMBLY_ACC=CAM_ASM_000606 /TAXON_ID=109239 /ORGANISM="Alexandrium margalefi, Strain AMGDE01CS-322" /LENGTH=289 /DNA_ID=CAMNT_0051521283 /DNA_START=44 /DNA_END=909 /DNA_ORIENTATION=-